jgi:enoyl-[acyl-carrier protein] reductase I
VTGSLTDRRILISGIANEQSLALAVAEQLQAAGAELVCAGLGRTRHNENLSSAAVAFLDSSREAFQKAVHNRLGSEVPVVCFDASLDESLDDAASEMSDSRLPLDGVVHAIAFDRTIRGREVKPLLEVTRQEFLDCMSVSAYSLIGLVQALSKRDLLNNGGSIVALSYLGAERITSHPYRNIGVAKAALERITRELAYELGHAKGIRVNSIRFSPYAESRAGGAIPDLEKAVADAALRAPLGNATPESLGREIACLMREGVSVTGETRHVDGGYHILA